MPCLLRSGLSLGRILGSCGQSYFLQMEADRTERQDIAFIELPVAVASAAQQCAFLPTEQMLERVSRRTRGCDVLTAIIQGRFGAADSLTVAEYINHALQREVMEHTPVSDNMALYRLLYAAAGMNGTVVNYALLANSVGVSAPTVKQWLQFLAGAGVIYFLQPIADIAGKRLVKASKLYFRDTAVAAYLLQLKDTAALASSLHFKNLYENYALNVLREGFLQQGILPEMRFYRDSNNAVRYGLRAASGRRLPAAGSGIMAG